MSKKELGMALPTIFLHFWKMQQKRSSIGMKTYYKVYSEFATEL